MQTASPTAAPLGLSEPSKYTLGGGGARTAAVTDLLMALSNMTLERGSNACVPFQSRPFCTTVCAPSLRVINAAEKKKTS